MKMIPMAMALLVNVPIVSAFAVDVGTLPMSDFADTEVSTNVAISLSAEAPRPFLVYYAHETSFACNCAYGRGGCRGGDAGSTSIWTLGQPA